MFKEQYAEVEISDDSLIKLEGPSHNYKFTRNTRGRGSYQLIVKNFKVIAELVTLTHNIPSTLIIYQQNTMYKLLTLCMQ